MTKKSFKHEDAVEIATRHLVRGEVVPYGIAKALLHRLIKLERDIGQMRLDARFSAREIENLRKKVSHYGPLTDEDTFGR